MKSFLLYFTSTAFAVNKIQIIKPNFCVNCKHFRYSLLSGEKFGRCVLFPLIENSNNEYYLVNGDIDENVVGYAYCSIARNYNDMWGREGKFFEQK